MSSERHTSCPFPTLFLQYEVTLNFSVFTWEAMGMTGTVPFKSAMLIPPVKSVTNVLLPRCFYEGAQVDNSYVYVLRTRGFQSHPGTQLYS